MDRCALGSFQILYLGLGLRCPPSLPELVQELFYAGILWGRGNITSVAGPFRPSMAH